MTAQKGKDLLIKIDDGGSFVTIAGLRARRLDVLPKLRLQMAVEDTDDLPTHRHAHPQDRAGQA